VRVIIADDEVLLRDGLARLLADAGVDVVAAVGTPDELRRRVVFDRPDAVIVDNVVVTEPIPDRLEEIGWTSQVGIADGRELLYYLRPTDDGRIAIGGGSLGVVLGGRASGRAVTHRRAVAEVAAVLALVDRFGLDDRIGVVRIPIARDSRVALTTERPDVRAALRQVVGRATRAGVMLPFTARCRTGKCPGVS